MRVLAIVFTIVFVIFSTAIIVNSFPVPPTAMCYTGEGGDCMKCDCQKGFKCYKGKCR
ncbi:unnamed protein product [Cylicocyclus nassatus]|uniref:Uncharacterized protein n=1 Tax=Cylicocyclus nassatus TaxID=53992 RepID=A0AA36MHE9_CYLNA|nr:unnamed protein product [Cylicocyclus nassatus]